MIAGVGRGCDEAGGRCRSDTSAKQPSGSAGSATLNVVTGNNDVNDNNDASVYISARAVGQRHGPCVGHGVRSSYAAWRPPAPAWRPMIRAFSGRCPGVSVTIQAAFTSRDVVDMVRTGAAELGLFVTSGPRTDKKVIAHAAGEQRFVATTTSHSYPATASASLTPPCTRERRRREQRDRRPAEPGFPRRNGRTGAGRAGDRAAAGAGAAQVQPVQLKELTWFTVGITSVGQRG